MIDGSSRSSDYRGLSCDLLVAVPLVVAEPCGATSRCAHSPRPTGLASMLWLRHTSQAVPGRLLSRQ